MQLTTDQVAQYRREGWLPVPGVLDAGELAALHAEEERFHSWMVAGEA